MTRIGQCTVTPTELIHAELGRINPILWGGWTREWNPMGWYQGVKK